jgi:hypothetical protein
MAFFIAHTGLYSLPAIAFDYNDVLYGLGYDLVNYNWSLYAISTSTGLLTMIGPANPGGTWRGMAFHPIDGNLWASTTTTDIWVIDPAHGTPTFVGYTGLFNGTQDLQFDKEGNLYGTSGGDGRISNLISIDQSTGVATVLSSLGFSSVSGLAARIEKPEGSHIGIFPKNVNFNEVMVNSNSALRTVIIRSIGTDTLTVSAITAPALPFSLSKVPSLPAIIPPGEKDSLEVTFLPTRVDTFDATITISSDDPDDPAKVISLSGIGVITGLEDDISQAGPPTRFSLHQNYPNPFNPVTAIRYEVPVTGRVSLKIYDILGREVTTLVDGVKTAGRYTVEWNAANLPSGVYLYRMQAGSFTATRKVVLIK